MPKAADFLLGLVGGTLEEAKKKREQGQDLTSKLLLAQQEARLKRLYPDPLTALLMNQLGGQSNGQPTQTPLGQVERITRGGITANLIPQEERRNRIFNESKSRAQGYGEGKASTLPLQPLSQESATVVSSAESAKDAIAKLLALEQQYPGVTKTALVAGNTPLGIGVALTNKPAQQADLLLKRLRTEITTARGGKQLTQTEIKFINQLMPSLFRQGDVNREGLGQLSQFLDSVRQRILSGRGSVDQADSLGTEEEDFGSMSDEELAAIANTP